MQLKRHLFLATFTLVATICLCTSSQAQNYGQITTLNEDLSPLGSIATTSTRIIDVTSTSNAYPVPTDGVSDAACPLHNLLSTYHNVDYGTTAPWQDNIFYIPDGTYNLSNPACLPIVKNYGIAAGAHPAYGMVLLGQTQGGVKLTLPANTLPTIAFSGNVTTGSRTITGVSSVTGLYAGQFLHGTGLAAGATIASVGTNSITISSNATATASGVSYYTTMPVLMTQSDLDGTQQFGNEAFHNVIENLTINIGWNTGNSGATGIAFVGSNMAVIRNVTINGNGQPGTKSSGIDMTIPLIGPALVENVTITGFDRGIDVANQECGVTIEHVTLTDQLSGALFNTDNLLTANLLDVKSDNTSKAVTNVTANGFVIIDNSNFEQTSSSLISNASGAPISFYNTTFASTQTGFPSGTANGTLIGTTFTANTLNMSYQGDTPVPLYDTHTQWVGFPASSTGEWTDSLGPVVDDAANLRRAFACPGNLPSTMYLPHGVYYISSPILIPSYVDRVIGMDATVRPTSSFPQNSALFEVVSTAASTCANPSSAQPLVIERLAFDNPYGVPNVSAVQLDAPATGVTARTVVLRDTFSIGISRMNQKLNGGKAYLENTMGSGMTISGPNSVFARQFNSEGGDDSGPRVTNNGAPLWILGFKTEGPLNVINSTTTTHTVNEVLGGYFITAPGTDTVAAGESCTSASAVIGTGNTSTPAMFIMATGSTLQASFIEEVDPQAGQTVATQSYPYYLSNPCQQGSGAAIGGGSSPLPSIHRYGEPREPAEAGFIVTQLNDAP